MLLLKAALRSHQHEVYRRLQEEREREELLSRRFTPTDHDTSIIIDYSVQHNSSLQVSVLRGFFSGSTLLQTLFDNSFQPARALYLAKKTSTIIFVFCKLFRRFAIGCLNEQTK